LLCVIDECTPTEPWCRVLASHLGLDGSGDKGRRFAVAGKLARLFERYAQSRPDMINAWRDGRDLFHVVEVEDYQRMRRAATVREL